MTLSRREESCVLPGECRSCKDPILWVVWPRSGKRMPIDYKPAPLGDIVVTHKKTLNQLHAEKYDPKQHVGRRRFVSHFSTCPNASEHRG